MLKDILSINGVEKLNKNQQIMVTGGTDNFLNCHDSLPYSQHEGECTNIESK